LARRLQYPKAKGESHENQDECEGWRPRVIVTTAIQATNQLSPEAPNKTDLRQRN
jgi:hypothetical protein